MVQLLKSALFWQLVGGFALGTIGMVMFGSPNGAHTIASLLGGVAGTGG
ncbi:MAG: hypothetical protein K2P68_01055 [Sphingomonas sp.]|nr:hypothetical protein [Sphingomonas sp.]